MAAVSTANAGANADADLNADVDVDVDANGHFSFHGMKCQSCSIRSWKLDVNLKGIILPDQTKDTLGHFKRFVCIQFQFKFPHQTINNKKRTATRKM